MTARRMWLALASAGALVALCASPVHGQTNRAAQQAVLQPQRGPTVPALKGLTLSAARDSLRNVKMTLVVGDSVAMRSGSGTVVSHLPAAGAPRPKDGVVRVTIAFAANRIVDNQVAANPVIGNRVAGSRAVAAPRETTHVVSRPLLVARAVLDSGDYRSSRELYRRSVGLATTRRDSATALFGQSFAAQQGIGRSSIPADTLTHLVESYRVAQRLDSTRYYVAAQQNVALLFSASGQHRRAADEYLRGARVRDSLRPELLLSAGRELVRANEPAVAVRTLTDAARDSAVAPDAQKLLLRIHVETRDTAALLALADSLRGPSAPLAAVNDALMAALPSSGPAAQARALALIARNAALLNTSPADPGSADAAWLERLVTATRGTTVAGAADALVDAYHRRVDAPPRPPHDSAAWWRRSYPGRRAAWSSAMRTIGDWYFLSGQPDHARTFYEEAIGLPGMMEFGAKWVDLEALPPLATIYGDRISATSTPAELRQIDMFVDALFGGKGGALQDNDLRRIRTFRLTLGSLFAKQKRWDGGWGGAIMQLEDVRRLTAELRRSDSSSAPLDPPEPFELLAAEYARRGCPAPARSAARESLAGYRRRGMTEDAARVEAFIMSLPADTPTTWRRCRPR